MKSPIKTVTLQDLQTAICKWADRTFGPQTQENRVKKLLKEVEELQKKRNDKTEICDCMIVLLQVAKGAGMDAHALITGCHEKHQINELRKWAVDSDGCHQHVSQR